MPKKMVLLLAGRRQAGLVGVFFFFAQSRKKTKSAELSEMTNMFAFLLCTHEKLVALPSDDGLDV